VKYPSPSPRVCIWQFWWRSLLPMYREVYT
jgi:hypothetical protein